MSLRILTACILLAASGVVMAKGDPGAGANKAKPCMACHGNNFDAEGDGQYPRLAGQYQDYLARALHEYANRERANPIMQGMVSSLSDTDIDDITAYISHLPSKLHDLSRMKKK
ncbi:MAG: cytochrome c [Proteobacteria bacterium]|nr:cytochrome c [Pseudomonadota bacterium]